MEFIFLGQTEESLSFSYILDGVKTDYGVFNLDTIVCSNKDEVRAAEMADEDPVEQTFERILVTDRTDYFGEVDVEDTEALEIACKKYLTEKKGINF